MKGMITKDDNMHDKKFMNPSEENTNVHAEALLHNGLSTCQRKIEN